MKARILLTFIVSLTLLISCKDEKKEGENKQPIKENFSAELDVTASKKDDFAMYFTEDNTTNFPTENAVWHGVKGGNVREKILFDLSKEKIPTDIRLDFGLKKDQDSVILYNIKIEYYGNVFNIKGSDFFKYFVENKIFKTEQDLPNQSLKIFKSNSDYTPFFYPKRELVDEIKKLTTTK